MRAELVRLGIPTSSWSVVVALGEAAIESSHGESIESFEEKWQ